MAVKVFVDANVFLEYFLKRTNFENCNSLMQLIVEGKILGYTSPSVLHILGYWLTKSFGTNKAKELLQLLLKEVTIIDCSHETALSALQSKIDDIEDALQYHTAIQNKIDCFISLDKILLKEKLVYVELYSPSEFIKRYT